MSLNGYTEELRGYNTVVKSGALPNANYVKAVMVPLGGIIQWCKTFGTADSGTTDSDPGANKLAQSGQNFQTTVTVGMIVRNTTDSTYSYVTAVDSNTVLTLADDIMDTAEAYVIYKTPYLPDGFVECNGQVLSDSDSPFNGETIPDLNVTKRFLRGSSTSGTTGGADSVSKVFQWGANGASDSDWALAAVDPDAQGNKTYPYDSNGSLTDWDKDDDSVNITGSYYTKAATIETIPAYYEVVHIMRVK